MYVRYVQGTTFLSVLRQLAQADPGRPALTYGDETLTRAEFADRLADMILVGGANVYPAEIEAALDEHPAVQSCCVIGLPDEDLGSIPYAIVELSEPISDADLLTHRSPGRP